MIDKSYNFTHKLVVIDGFAVREKHLIRDEIFHVLTLNNYMFHPFFRPCPPVLVNWKDISYQYLALLLQRLVEYCQINSKPCLDGPVVVCGDGVHESLNDSRCVIVEELADDWFNAYPLPLGQVSYSVRQFLDKGLSNARVMVY